MSIVFMLECFLLKQQINSNIENFKNFSYSIIECDSDSDSDIENADESKNGYSSSNIDDDSSYDDSNIVVNSDNEESEDDDDVLIVRRKKNQNNYISIILKFFEHNEVITKWKDLYDFVDNELSGKSNICPYTNRPISRQVFEGRLRSCVEEHSSDSRQHYFRNGLLKPEGWRKNLFHNRRLRILNEQVNWRPYNRVRGDGWRLGSGSNRPDDDVLKSAEELYRIKGRRRGVPIINDDVIYKSIYVN
jgi:hypothetical protein